MQADWEEHRLARRHAQPVYCEAEQKFNEKIRALLTSAPNSRKWRATIKTAVFGASSCLPPLVDRGGGLVWSSGEKALWFLVHFDAKHYKIGFSNRTLVPLVQYSVLFF